MRVILQDAGMWMRVWVVTLMVGMVVLPQPAAAAPWDYRPGIQGQERRPPPRQAPFRKGDGREQRAVPPDRDDRSRQRLSEEERRELHRDLDRANREIYRRKGQR